MTARSLGAALCAVAAVLCPLAVLALEPAWTVDGLDGPESALHDQERDVIYVSNVNGDPTEKDGQGYIAKLDPDGSLMEKAWVSGLDAPKGLALIGDTLYVTDIDRLVAIDVKAGEVSATYPVAGAEFLNDAAAAPDGRVFVSDMATNTIHVLQGDTIEVFVQDEELTGPNGLLVEGDQLVVAAWGKIKEGFTTETPGHLKTVDLVSKAIAPLGDGTPVGNLDGIVPDGSGAYLVTDWVAGKYYRIQASGQAELLLDLGQGSADLGLIADQRLAIIPMMMDGQVVAYPVE